MNQIQFDIKEIVADILRVSTALTGLASPITRRSRMKLTTNSAITMMIIASMIFVALEKRGGAFS